MTDDGDVRNLTMSPTDLVVARERTFNRVYESLIRGLYLDEVLNEIYESFQDLIPFDRIGCGLLSDDGQRIVARWGRTRLPGIRLRPGFGQQVAETSLGEILSSGQPRIIDDLEQYFADHPTSKSTRLVLQEGIRSSLSCPLLVDGRPIGVLFFSSAEKGTYHEIHQETFQRLASAVATVVERSQLYEELARLNRELTETRDLLREMATHDELTGVWNRAAILSTLDVRLKQAVRQRRMLAVGMCDVDRFKNINDTFGHQVGDDVLSGVAVMLQGVLRAGDEIGRYGGEEFLLVADLAHPDEMAPFGERLRAAVAEGAFGSERHGLPEEIRVTISIGLSLHLPGTDDNPRELIRRADAALYEAKRTGRNKAVIAPPV